MSNENQVNQVKSETSPEDTIEVTGNDDTQGKNLLNSEENVSETHESIQEQNEDGDEEDDDEDDEEDDDEDDDEDEDEDEDEDDDEDEDEEDDEDEDEDDDEDEDEVEENEEEISCTKSDKAEQTAVTKLEMQDMSDSSAKVIAKQAQPHEAYNMYRINFSPADTDPLTEEPSQPLAKPQVTKDTHSSKVTKTDTFKTLVEGSFVAYKNNYTKTHPGSSLKISTISINTKTEVNEEQTSYKVTLTFPQPPEDEENKTKFQNDKREFIEGYIKETLQALKDQGQHFIARTPDGDKAWYLGKDGTLYKDKSFNEIKKIADQDRKAEVGAGGKMPVEAEHDGSKMENDKFRQGLQQISSRSPITSTGISTPMDEEKSGEETTSTPSPS